MKDNFKHKIKLHNLMFIYVITTIIVSVVSLSKYVTTVSKTNIARVAVMATNTSVEMNPTTQAHPGTEVIYPIILTNKEGEKVCDVAQKFSIEISREENRDIPLEYNLYEDEYGTKVIEKDENGVFQSEDFVFGTSEESKTVYLKIVWPEEYNDEFYAFEMGYFLINITAEQLD